MSVPKHTRNSATVGVGVTQRDKPMTPHRARHQEPADTQCPRCWVQDQEKEPRCSIQWAHHSRLRLSQQPLLLAPGLRDNPRPCCAWTAPGFPPLTPARPSVLRSDVHPRSPSWVGRIPAQPSEAGRSWVVPSSGLRSCSRWGWHGCPNLWVALREWVQSSWSHAW